MKFSFFFSYLSFSQPIFVFLRAKRHIFALDAIAAALKALTQILNQAESMTPPQKAPAQKAQQGVSVRKCTRSVKEKRPEETSKICEEIKRIKCQDQII